LGEGTADFPELLGRLEDHRYRGWFVLGRDEPTDPQEIGNALRYLTEL
jgi:sugar phosphate isomerase/epimerase